MKLRQLFLTFLFLLAAFQVCFSQENKLPEIWNNGVFHSHWEFGNIPDNEIAEIKKRWEEIGDSLKTTSNHFAGTYYQFGNRGYFLRWSPEKGFVYAYFYETFVLAASYGKVSVTDSEVKFTPEREMTYKGVSGELKTPTVWIPAYKGKYLIRKKSIQNFGDFYGGFGDYNGFPNKWFCDCAPFAERVEKDANDLKTNSFLLPKKYLSFLKQPITAKIIFVGKNRISTHPLSLELDNKASITPVTINVGRKSGISRGLLFLLKNEDSFIEVTKVGEKSSQAIVVRELDENGKEAYSDGWDNALNKTIYKTYSPIRAGIKISTSSIVDF
ncbi:MAG: hypothetical protein ACR2MG_05735 [Pyrinomonadaceae bacterium]